MMNIKNVLSHLHRNRLHYIILTVFIDQLFKHNLNSVIFNTGASFGILKGYAILLTIISIAIIALLVYLSYKTKDNLLLWSYALIIGGAASNLLDRVMLGFVIDYIPFPFFPTFNLADVMITVGAALFIRHEWLHRKKEK